MIDFVNPNWKGTALESMCYRVSDLAAGSQSCSSSATRVHCDTASFATEFVSFVVPPLGGSNSPFPAEAGTTNEAGPRDDAFLNTLLWHTFERPGGALQAVDA